MVLYRVLFHHFERFLIEYERRFEREYGYFQPVVREVVGRYLDCGNPRSGFARIRCPDCHGEHLLTFSCKMRDWPRSSAGRCSSFSWTGDCSARGGPGGFSPGDTRASTPTAGSGPGPSPRLSGSATGTALTAPSSSAWTTWSSSPGSSRTSPIKARSWSATTVSTPMPTGARSGKRAASPPPSRGLAAAAIWPQ